MNVKMDWSQLAISIGSLHCIDPRFCWLGLGKDIELRHQRKPDVVFDTVRRSPGKICNHDSAVKSHRRDAWL